MGLAAGEEEEVSLLGETCEGLCQHWGSPLRPPGKLSGPCMSLELPGASAKPIPNPLCPLHLNLATIASSAQILRIQNTAPPWFQLSNLNAACNFQVGSP